ncbi:quinone-dependent dihydroorotate dehydrogenase [Flavobacteriales bacterium]|nr:quinone-dependent dihydroorotate dehydrogenase [Flavobacteriales bacterium]
MYKLLVRPILFLFDPEKIHHFVFNSIRNLFKIPGFKFIAKSIHVFDDPKLEKELFGLKFKNPVGLAAGFDKDAKLFNELSSFGFGFIEIGTLTPLPQDGNPKKRMFRLPKDSGLINRMGFNNGGVKEAVERLKKNNSGIIIGGNIGKNKLTPNENATDDYVICFEELHPHVDYFVVNVSSPNTPNLRALQDKEPLTQLLNKLVEMNAAKDIQRPILLKIAPDLTDSQLDDIIDIVADTKIDGVISSNTTISREGLNTDQAEIEKIGNGGLSGKPLTKRATEVIRYLSSKSNKAFPIIGVGGIHSAEDAIEKLEAGADLVQVYTGFIYEGPSLIKKINKEILKRK